MSFLGKNINLALVALVLAIVVIATGTTVVYQRGLQERTQQFETTSTNLSQCLAQVENYRSELQKTETDLLETSQDISKYDQIYGQKVDELTDKEQELTKTKSSLNAMTAQKEQYKNLYSSALLNISSLENDIVDLEEVVDDLKADKSRLAAELAECQSGS